MNGTDATTIRQRPDKASAQDLRCLRVLRTPDATRAGQLIPLVASDVHIGRGEQPPPHATFSDPQMSRSHATVRRQSAAGRHAVTDDGSTNGTRVNGTAVGAADLEVGDVVRVGDTLLLYDRLPGLDGPPPSRGTSLLRGRSPAMLELVSRIERTAASDLAVLVLGETGTGKELVARDVHRKSGRSGPFLAVNCGAIAENLIESELFGHARGAFTGATGASRGLFRAADGGTLFLDEIGELPAALQASLLRVLETGEVRPVGATSTFRVDTRVVAATNRDLDQACLDGAFREDLYARLDQIRLELPPLRERRGDILELLAFFFDEHGGGRPSAVDADVAEALVVNPWRHNVRELLKLVRVLLLEHPDTDEFDLAALPPAYRPAPRSTDSAEPPPPDPSADPHAFRERIQARGGPTREELERLLVLCRGRVVDVAAFLEKDRRQVYRWLRRHDIEVEEYRA